VRPLVEGHKIKNNSIAISKRCRDVQASRRFILTGTPIQNSLKELWALFDFTCYGLLFGDLKRFTEEFGTPIAQGTLKFAAEKDVVAGATAAERLRNLISPVFLRREKATRDKDGCNMPKELDGGRTNDGSAMPEKLELVCWVFLLPTQVRMYLNFLSSEKVQGMLNSTKSPLAALTVLKKICDHPTLLKNYTAFAAALNGVEEGSDVAIAGDPPSAERAMPPAASNAPRHVPQPSFDLVTPARSLASNRGSNNAPPNSETAHKQSWDTLSDAVVQESGKLKFLLELLQRLHHEKHRVLVFSKSKQMLTIICDLIKNQYKYLRLDGDTTDAGERSQLVDKYNSTPDIFAFFLTTQVKTKYTTPRPPYSHDEFVLAYCKFAPIAISTNGSVVSLR
jgi:SNF2 family DNA or RNA helicase